MDIIILISFIGGLALLIVGADLLVRGASRLAIAIGLSPLVIGLTVVAYGTSAPELAICLKASVAGQSGIVIGNVIGSNISNVLLILGLSALLKPLVVSRQLIRLDVPIMIASSLLMLFMAMDGMISRGESILLVIGIIIYTFWLLQISRKESKAIKDEYKKKITSDKNDHFKKWLLYPAFIVIGLGLLVLGARFLVDAAVSIAESFGVSELIIGLTIIAVGTSLPEIATAIIATIRGNRDIVIGNVIGSNISNVLAIIGLTGVFAVEGIPVAQAALQFDIPVMIAVSIACLPIFLTGHRIGRKEGLLFFGYYIFYMLYLILAAGKHDALESYSNVMIQFVIPLTVITIVGVLFRYIKANRVLLKRS